MQSIYLKVALWTFVVGGIGCSDPSAENLSDAAVEPVQSGLPLINLADEARAKKGESYLTETAITPPSLPVLGFRSLWTVWGESGGDDETYWRKFRERYGMHEAPFDNGPYPLGLRVSDGNAALDCMTCHGGRIAGQTIMGLANTEFQMQRLFDDLQALAQLAGLASPFDIDNGTAGPGANDAWGLGIQLGVVYAPDQAPEDLNTSFGYQRPTAWWTIKHKSRMYSDASASSSGHHTMMAMLLAYGATQADFAAASESFEDLKHYLWSIPSPEWPFEDPDAASAKRGEQVFQSTCAPCHGAHSGENAEYLNHVEPFSSVGTDPARAENFGDKEATFVNSFLGGVITEAEPLQATQGYLAQPLVGIWARAPYFHNGSVPTLRGVIESVSRPTVWRRTGNEEADYDKTNVGLRYEEPSDAGDFTIYDTRKPGLSNQGHTFGDALTDQERDDLLNYLKLL